MPGKSAGLSAVGAAAAVVYEPLPETPRSP